MVMTELWSYGDHVRTWVEPTRRHNGAHAKPIKRVEPKSPPTRQLETRVYLIAPEREAIDNDLS